MNLVVTDGAVKLKWQVHGGNPKGIVVERRRENAGANKSAWERIANLPATATEYADSGLKKEEVAAYRVRAFNKEGESAYSNVVRRSLGH